MKQKDIAMVVVAIIVGAGLSLVLSNVIIGTPANKQQQAEVVQPISSSFAIPDGRFFNKDAFDPTQTITIGQSANPDPFSGATGSGQ